MKKLILAVTLLSVFHAPTCLANMLIVFNNRVAGVVDAPVSRPSGSGAGAGVTAQLLRVNEDGSLTALMPKTTFRTTSAAASFYVQPVQITVPGIRSGGSVMLRMRAWTGDDFATATLRGESNDFELKNSSAVNNLVGLKKFKLTDSRK